MKDPAGISTADSSAPAGRRTGFCCRSLWLGIAMVASLLVQGCNFGRVSFIEIPPTSTNSDCDLSSNVCGFLKGQSVEFKVWGEGPCTLARLNFGDGQFIEGSNIDFGQSGATKPWVVSHTYQGWPGPKTATAEGVTNCTGKITQSLHVFQRMGNTGVSPEVFLLGFAQPGGTACTPVPNVPPLRPKAMVKITTDSSPRINFGCAFNGCIFDADGDKTSTAPANFAFPGFRKYSMILRLGTQVVQGGTNISFTTNQSGPLEACVNDDNLPDNIGGWGINIFVDESQSP